MLEQELKSHRFWLRRLLAGLRLLPGVRLVVLKVRVRVEHVLVPFVEDVVVVGPVRALCEVVLGPAGSVRVLVDADGS